ncbi:hypothetical protein KY092_20460 [Natronomonas gomsonensis]|uniref:DUF7342 family protein n=1 Tax=Natronomonas gomsonensis TaxID=1046043 RepID=UPI00227AE0A9|nr:hypothetical protein [Natronomonas gomsonensis]MCY4732905.1 hypothetical protein [Natronomonas gomsonensis]
MQALRDLLDNWTRDDLLELRGDLQEQVEEWQTEYDADSPSDLRERAANADTAEATREMRRLRSSNNWLSKSNSNRKIANHSCEA